MSTYFRLLKYLRPHLGVFWLAISCMAISSLLEGLQLGALIPLADRIVTNQSIPTPTWVPGWLAALLTWLNGIPPLTLLAGFAIAIPFLFFFKGLFEFLQTFYMDDTANRISRDLRQELFDHLMGLSLDQHQQQPTGATMSRINYDTGVIQNSITEGIYDLIYQSFKVAVCLGIALAIHWRFALTIFIVVPLLAWPMVHIGKLLKKISQQTQVAMGQLTSTMLESLSGIRVIQSFQGEAAARRKFGGQNEWFYRLRRKQTKRLNFLSPVTETIGALGGALVFWYGGCAVLQGELTLGLFLVFLGAMLSLVRPFKRLARLHSINQQAVAAAERIFEVLDAQSSVAESPQARALPPFHRELTFDRVSFQYVNQPVLRGVSLTVRHGEILAIVGPSGAGKSTLVSLVPRFFDPQHGRVLLDGIDVRHVTLASLRRQVGLVTQETVLFNDSVRANIALGVPEATLEQVIEAAKAANAHRFISRLPQGYDTTIGDRGERLSGGERQRLAIARAFLKNPPLLILDEATNQLDAESERLITDAVERIMQGRTVLLIAHRLSTVRLAHRIVLLQEGRVVESGSHDELLHKSPLYRRFCELQLIDAGVAATSSS